MATEEVGTIKKVGDKYRSFLHKDTENTTQRRHGGPPSFDTVNQLIEEGRAKEWPKGSLEEEVQNAIKTWDMEIEHKTRAQDILRPSTLTRSSSLLMVHQTKTQFGREGLAAEEIIRMGSYNALLKNSLPKEFQYYNVDDETLESSHDAFRFALPRGLAWEVLSVYSALSKNHLNLITYAVK
ncbi:hypothetical protein NC653_004026 [Populus alba x Populus x berolinensis]|uniref:Uncharacterized protein n=1 Tax=Populus alba x Populus x berolinensis TaxID=444605 RepID=A0AAD6RU07_9ROSI|nr:hypothetical protein NC653_004026 [Populus alba x Populus x berolinensis]